MGILLNPACHSCSCVGTIGTFIGGEFTTVDGTSRIGVAKLAGDGTLDVVWSADLADGGGNASIKAMVLDGTTLYVGGNFDTIGGTARECLAALDTVSGTVSSWTADISTGGSDNVDCLLLDGSDLYVGGTFTSLGGSARNNAGVVSTAGVVGSWDPDFNGTVLCMAEDSGIIYIGGSFTTADGGTTRNRLAAFDTAGAIQAWDPDVSTASSSVRTMVIDSGIVYFGGAVFTTVAGSSRNRLAAYSTAGALESWDPNLGGITPQVRILAIVDSIVYIGGNYSSVSGGTTRNHLSAFHTDGTLQSWDPNVAPTNASGSANGIYDMIVDDDIAYCIGVFSSFGGVTRNDAAAIGINGTLADWNPNLAGGSPTGESIIAAA